MKDLRDKIGNLMKTGKSVIGSKQVIKSLLTGNPKLVIISNNCSDHEREEITYYSRISNVPLEVAEEDGFELGSVCGKPFPISAICVLDEGESGIVSGKK